MIILETTCSETLSHMGVKWLGGARRVTERYLTRLLKRRFDSYHTSMKNFIKYTIVWISQNLAIPFWVVGHIHLSIHSFLDLYEL